MPDLSALPTALLLAVVPSLAYLAILNAVDRYEKEPWTILLACLGLGAIVAPAISLAVLGLAGRPVALAPQFAPGAGGGDPLVGAVQELAKAGVLLALVRLVRDEFDDVLDGVIYGAAIGAGFAAAETFAFALGGTGELRGETLGALLVAGLDHAFYTAAFGAVAGWATRLPDARQAWIVVGYGAATSVLLHVLHDSLPAILGRLLERPDAVAGTVTRVVAQLINVLGVLTLAVVVVLAWRREGRVVRTRLADEVRLGVIGDEDLATIPSLRRRMVVQLAAARSRGWRGARDVERFHEAAGELAFHKERLEVRRRRRPAPERTEQLREEVRRLRRTLEEGTR